MRILVLTSCTGRKSVTSPTVLSLDDFRQGDAHVAAREAALRDRMVVAEDLYQGQQHVRLMRGVRAIRAAHTEVTVDVWIVSTGYGLVHSNQCLAPYEATFSGMRRAEAREWAQTLGIQATARTLLSEPYDLALILLGETYLDVTGIAQCKHLGGPTLLVTSAGVAGRLPTLPHLRLIALTKADTRRFSCGLVGIKGEVAARVLESVARDATLLQRFVDPQEDVLSMIDWPVTRASRTTRQIQPNPAVNHVIELPEDWVRRSSNARFRYFLPDWDDHVDPEFDFETETHSHGAGDWSNEAYAHQLLQTPSCDGILISKIGAERGARKRERINNLGVHRYLRVPREFPVMGDCGAFGYVQQETPPYSTSEILDYYTRLGFDFGVSIDHLIVSQVETQRRFRYDLTIDNATEFLREHRQRGLPWTPVGAVQGWDPVSYARAAQHYVAMGYDYIALGGLVRSSSADILRIVAAVHDVVPAHVRVHLFGIGRLDAVREFARLGVTSIDSASMMRKAWLGSTYNYLACDGWYTAIRVPQASASFRARRIVSKGQRTLEQLLTLEQRCLAGLREHARGRENASPGLLDVLVEYDALVAGGVERRGQRERIRRTLDERPWERCDCVICKRWGIEVMIFRGNNRNRRRGFHNTWAFYQLLDQLFAGEHVPWLRELVLAGLPGQSREPVEQLSLFAAGD